MHPIRWVMDVLVRLLLPSSGRHRAGTGAACAQTDLRADVPAMRPTVRAVGPALRGEDIGHVRPYFVAHERKQKAQRKRARRRTLWLAVHGVDIGPRMMHGVRAAS